MVLLLHNVAPYRVKLINTTVKPRYLEVAA